MSYARFAEDSDVYVFLAVDGFLECCACALGGQECFDTTDAMLTHLDEHKTAGHDVPECCIARLTEGREENDAWIADRAALPNKQAESED